MQESFKIDMILSTKKEMLRGRPSNPKVKQIFFDKLRLKKGLE